MNKEGVETLSLFFTVLLEYIYEFFCLIRAFLTEWSREKIYIML
mgnify:FL=1